MPLASLVRDGGSRAISLASELVLAREPSRENSVVKPASPSSLTSNCLRRAPPTTTSATVSNVQRLDDTLISALARDAKL